MCLCVLKIILDLPLPVTFCPLQVPCNCIVEIYQKFHWGLSWSHKFRSIVNLKKKKKTGIFLSNLFIQFILNNSWYWNKINKCTLWFIGAIIFKTILLQCSPWFMQATILKLPISSFQYWDFLNFFIGYQIKNYLTRLLSYEFKFCHCTTISSHRHQQCVGVHHTFITIIATGSRNLLLVIWVGVGTFYDMSNLVGYTLEGVHWYTLVRPTPGQANLYTFTGYTLEWACWYALVTQNMLRGVHGVHTWIWK